MSCETKVSRGYDQRGVENERKSGAGRSLAKAAHFQYQFENHAADYVRAEKDCPSLKTRPAAGP